MFCATRSHAKSKARGCGATFFRAARCEDSPLDEIFRLLPKFHTSGQSARGLLRITVVESEQDGGRAHRCGLRMQPLMSTGITD